MFYGRFCVKIYKNFPTKMDLMGTSNRYMQKMVQVYSKYHRRKALLKWKFSDVHLFNINVIKVLFAVNRSNKQILSSLYFK